MTRLQRIGRFLLVHRRRFAPAVLLVAVLVIGGELFGATPRKTEIRYDLGPDHAQLTDARIGYVLKGDEVKGVRFHYPDGAPTVVRHEVSLTPGRYRVVAELHGPSIDRTVQRALRVPAQGVVHMELFDEALAEDAP